MKHKDIIRKAETLYTYLNLINKDNRTSLAEVLEGLTKYYKKRGKK